MNEFVLWGYKEILILVFAITNSVLADQDFSGYLFFCDEDRISPTTIGSMASRFGLLLDHSSPSDVLFDFAQ